MTRSTEWRAHGIDIEVEREYGLRAEGQESTGSFAVFASRTLTGTLDEMLEH